jgi:hypothetical protein
VNHWTSGTVCECSEIAESGQASPQQQVVKPEGGPAASVKPGQKNCVISSGIITMPRRWPSDSSRWGHQCSKTTLTGESRFHISTPSAQCAFLSALCTFTTYQEYWIENQFLNIIFQPLCLVLTPNGEIGSGYLSNVYDFKTKQAQVLCCDVY